MLLGFVSVFAVVPNVQLYNGVQMPVISFGTWQYNDTEAYDYCNLALDAGFTHFDCAHDYNNQYSVGNFFTSATAEKGRDNLFLTSKVPGCGLQGVGAGKKCHDDTIAIFEEDLKQLRVDYVDLMLIHFPPTTGCNALTCPEIQSQWAAFELMYKQGKARSIGVSNWCVSCFECIEKSWEIKPMVNQIQYHVGMGPDPLGLHSYCRARDIVVEAYSPLGDGSNELITGNLTNGIGEKYGKSGVQIALKWILQNKVSLSTKASSAKHIAADLDIFDFTISDEDMTTLNEATSPAGTSSFMCTS